MKLLLTGDPGAGKTTLLRYFIDLGGDCQGFLAEEVRVDGQRTGFRLKSHDGRTATPARTDSTSTVRVSRYGVEVEAFEAFLHDLPPIDPSKPVYVDEIGQMQLSSDSFRRLVGSYLDTAKLYIGTISHVFEDDFTREVKARPDVIQLHLTVGNRQVISGVIEGLSQSVEFFMQLDDRQRLAVTAMARQYANEERYIQLRKLFKNAVKYVAIDAVRLTDDGYAVTGNHDYHQVRVAQRGEYMCDCDLFHGRGEFADAQGECSHIQAVKLYLAAVV